MISKGFRLLQYMPIFGFMDFKNFMVRDLFLALWMWKKPSMAKGQLLALSEIYFNLFTTDYRMLEYHKKMTFVLIYYYLPLTITHLISEEFIESLFSLDSSARAPKLSLRLSWIRKEWMHHWHKEAGLLSIVKHAVLEFCFDQGAGH